MPKISVLMPVYNTSAEYLQEAIESILNQTFTDFELLILDDGSDHEDTLHVLSDYSQKDKRVKVIPGEHKGIGAARNRLLKAAQGDFFAIMDSDDISLPQRLEKQILFLETEQNIDVCGTYFECFPETSICKHKQNVNYLDFLKEMSIGNPTVMFRKKIIEQYNLSYNENISTSEDYEFFSRAIKYVKIANIPEILLKYRILETSNSHYNLQTLQKNDHKIKQNMLDFLTDDPILQQKIMDLICTPPSKPLQYNLGQKIFSIRNYQNYKYLSILGIKIKFIRKQKYNIIKLQGGLGNQMFQYAFGLALKAKTGRKTLFDKSWFDEALRLANNSKEFTNGIAIREYNLNIFNIAPFFASYEQSSSCTKKVTEQKNFIFEPKLLKKKKSTYYEGYFQNEKYFKDIKDTIKKEFTFPPIQKNDDFNNTWLNKIKACENPVFIHLRRGDYLNLQGWTLTTEYYKKAIQYITEHINNPTFFIFGQNCEDYIKNEFKMDIPFEIIGETNSQKEEDWKDIVLMMQCKHAIIANSTFSWWAAWLGNANKGIVIAPSPFINGQDEIICDNWIKIASS